MSPDVYKAHLSNDHPAGLRIHAKQLALVLFVRDLRTALQKHPDKIYKSVRGSLPFPSSPPTVSTLIINTLK